MKTKSLFLLFAFLIIFSGNITAQKYDFSKLDSLIQITKDGDRFMGSISVFKSGKIIYSRAIGYEDLEKKLNATTESKYVIGSVSKMFTCALIFKAIENGKISLDQPIQKYFPDVKNAGKITIEDLLGHRSGIHNFTNDANYPEWCTQQKSRQEMVTIISQGTSDFEPGTKLSYSNSNYVLLSILLEKLYKKPYGDILQKEIVKPLKLENTYFSEKIDHKEHVCYSYKRKNASKWEKSSETDSSIPLGAGAIISNPKDLCIFIEALLTGKIVSENSLTKIKTIKDGFGLGIFQYPFMEKKLYGHTGGIDSFSSFLTSCPEDTLSVAITSNGSDFSLNNFALCAYSCFYHKPFSAIAFKTITIEPGELDKYLGVYSTSQLPLKLTITKSGDKLTAQGTGQSSFGLDAYGNNIFKSADMRIVLEFKPQSNEMILSQSGLTFNFQREK